MKFSLISRVVLIIFVLLNILLFFFIGITITSLQSQDKYMMGIILFPLLIIVDLITFRKFNSFLCHCKNDYIENLNDDSSSNLVNKYQIKLSNDNKVALIIHQKKYIFSFLSIIVLLIGGPLLAIIIYMFFNLEINNWLPELIAIQSSYLLDLFFRINSEVLINSEIDNLWYLYIPQKKHSFFFDPMCTAIHIFSIYTGMIICIPKSLDPETAKTILWRKTITLFFSISIIHIVNLFRICFLIYGDYNGFPWELYHNLVNYISGAFAALLFIFLVKIWVPEMFLSLYYLYPTYKYNKLKTISNN